MKPKSGLMKSTLGLALILGAGVAGCKSAGDIPTARPVGIFNISAASDNQGGWVMAPTAVFYQGALPNINSAGSPDTCLDTLINLGLPENPGPAQYTNQLDAGSPISINTSLGTQDIMTPDTIPGLISYKIPNAGVVAYVPGGQVSFAIPGVTNGFPSATFVVTTSAPLTLEEIPPNPTTEFDVTWNAGDANSAVVLHMLYAKGDTATDFNREIFCAVPDNGDKTVNLKLARLWAASNNNLHLVKGYRWKTTFLNTTDNGILLGIAQFNFQKTIFP
ncbi:MAG TPA: hypothetical protein VEI06_15555 [Gemmatimonadaceae bacterium]|nr:hypothetical protein [Gemmatimonadaceae bacterium]